jgi:hypothetical protein
MFSIGDIVQIYAPVAGHIKYHLCIAVGTDGAATQFLFLNSDPDRMGSYVVPCERVPCLEPSKTGKTAFSFTMIPRYSDGQMRLYKAEKLGELDSQLAAELLGFAKTVRTLPRKDLKVVTDALEKIATPSEKEVGKSSGDGCP